MKLTPTSRNKTVEFYHALVCSNNILHVTNWMQIGRHMLHNYPNIYELQTDNYLAEMHDCHISTATNAKST